MDNVWIALELTILAGLATAVGSAIAFVAKRTDYRFLSVSTGFSAGVLVYVSLVDLLDQAFNRLGEFYGQSRGSWIALASFFGGIALIAIIDNLTPHTENPHEPVAAGARRERQALPGRPANPHAVHIHGPVVTRPGEPGERHELFRTGLLTAVAIAVHNFPEGLTTFFSTLRDPQVGMAIAVAIGLHNIPEGVSISVPIYYATGRRGQAFLYSLISGLSEPLGAVLAYAGLRLLVGDQGGPIPWQVMGVLFGAVAGIMVYISLDELLPTSRAYGRRHDSLLGLLAGMAIMAVSLVLLS
jgi:ZIP family zinc transporter